MIFENKIPLRYRVQLNNKPALENYKEYKEYIRRGETEFPEEELKKLIEDSLTDILSHLETR